MESPRVGGVLKCLDQHKGSVCGSMFVRCSN